MKEKGNISINTENIFPIIKKFLYSDQDIFLRELISNAVDATQKLKSLSLMGEMKNEIGEDTIEVILDEKKKTITISDKGIGMSANEIKKYINQIAFSGASEFLEKYKDKGDEQQIIGHFGLGFYSAFMVSNKVEINSKSFKKGSKSANWTCDGNTEFEIKESKKKEKVEMIKDFFELQKLKNFFLTSSAYDHENTIDKKLFTRILRKFKSETAEWNGKFIVVYLPEWNRFNQKSFTHFFHKKKIESIIKSLNIPYIDMVQEFEKEEDPINFYPFGLFGHYTAEGYRLVAESIFKNITD